MSTTLIARPRKPELTSVAPTPSPRDIQSAWVRETGSPVSPLILVVDDHEDSRAIERLLLENAGFRVVEAETGREGLRLAAEHRPSVVLLDLILPELDGWSVARRLRADADTCGAVIIAVTAVAGADDQDRALLAGCNEILTKPVPPTLLLAAVRRYVSCAPASGRRGP